MNLFEKILGTLHLDFLNRKNSPSQDNSVKMKHSSVGTLQQAGGNIATEGDIVIGTKTVIHLSGKEKSEIKKDPQPIEFFKFLHIFALDESSAGNVQNWDIGSSPDAPIIWKTKGIEWSEKDSSYARHGEALLSINGEIINKLEEKNTPVYWKVALKGSRVGVETVVVECPIITPEELSFLEELERYGTSIKLLETKGNTDGYSTHEIKFLRKKSFVLKYEWSYGSAGCLHKFSIILN